MLLCSMWCDPQILESSNELLHYIAPADSMKMLPKQTLKLIILGVRSNSITSFLLTIKKILACDSNRILRNFPKGFWRECHLNASSPELVLNLNFTITLVTPAITLCMECKNWRMVADLHRPSWWKVSPSISVLSSIDIHNLARLLFSWPTYVTHWLCNQQTCMICKNLYVKFLQPAQQETKNGHLETHRSPPAKDWRVSHHDGCSHNSLHR